MTSRNIKIKSVPKENKPREKLKTNKLKTKLKNMNDTKENKIKEIVSFQMGTKSCMYGKNVSKWITNSYISIRKYRLPRAVEMAQQLTTLAAKLTN